MIGTFRTSDCDEAHRLLVSSYGPNRMFVGPEKPFDFALWWTEQKRSRIGYSSYGTDVQITVPPLEAWYVVCFPTRGRIAVASGSDSARLTPSRGAVLYPFDELRFEKTSADCTIVSLQVSRGEVEDELAAILARPVAKPIRFDLDVDFRVDRGALLPSALQFLHDALAERRAFPQSAPGTEPPAMMDRLDRMLVTGLLLGQPNNYTEELRAPARPAPPAQIRRVMERIESDPAAIASAADLARAACLSLRALEEGFRRYVGVAPMAYLRDTRLARARSLLADADPTAASVTEIAYRCGFLHLGRFAADYRRKYGVSPSQTLRGGKWRTEDDDEHE